MEFSWDLIGWFLLSSVKFLFVPLSMPAFSYGYWEIIVTTIAGGCSGILFFFYYGRWAIDQYTAWRNRVRPSDKKPRKFNRMNRIIIKVKKRFGLIGLVIITPCMISIPIGCVLAARYYGRDRRTVPYLLIATVGWAFILTTFSDSLGELLGYR